MKETNPEFCTGVQILLSRMESNPEEFTSGDKWYWIMNKVVEAKRNPTHHALVLAELTPEEINALFNAYTPFLRKRFDDSVMKEVLTDAEELSYSVTTAPTVLGGTSGGSWTSPIMMTSNTSLATKIHQIQVNQNKAILNTLGLKEKV